MKKIQKKTKIVTFKLEVDNNFDSYNFFKDFKEYQFKGKFEGVIGVKLLDPVLKKELSYEDVCNKRMMHKDDSFICTESQMLEYGVKSFNR